MRLSALAVQLRELQQPARVESFENFAKIWRKLKPMQRLHQLVAYYKGSGCRRKWSQTHPPSKVGDLMNAADAAKGVFRFSEEDAQALSELERRAGRRRLASRVGRSTATLLVARRSHCVQLEITRKSITLVFGI